MESGVAQLDARPLHDWEIVGSNLGAAVFNLIELNLNGRFGVWAYVVRIVSIPVYALCIGVSYHTIDWLIRCLNR